MFRKNIEAIIAEGSRSIQAQADRVQDAAVGATKEVDRCLSEIQSLVTLAQQVPEKVFDRYSTVLVATFETRGQMPFYSEIRIADTASQLRGLMGDETLKPGKYRAIVLLEPIS